MQFKTASKTSRGTKFNTGEDAKAMPCHQLPLQVFTGKPVSPLIVYCIVSGLAHFPEPGTYNFNEADTKLVT